MSDIMIQINQDFKVKLESIDYFEIMSDAGMSFYYQSQDKAYESVSFVFVG